MPAHAREKVRPRRPGEDAFGKQRLDTWLVEHGFAPSREKAKALVIAGKVLVEGRRADKAGSPVAPGSRVEVAGTAPYVSRGGEKLEGALEAFPVQVAGRTALDVGASTGGFTDCLLQRGAARVYAVDVGYGQMAWKLQQDRRVVRLDRINIRKAGRETVPEACDLAVIDTSFISLKLVLPPTLRFLKGDGELIALVKPQFEVGKGKVGKRGIVRDPALHREVLLDLVGFAVRSGLAVAGWTVSPLTGAGGNREFFLYLKRGGSGDRSKEIEEQIRDWSPPPA